LGKQHFLYYVRENINYTKCEQDVRATNKADPVLAKADLDIVF